MHMTEIQRRDTLAASEYTLHRRLNDKEVLLRDSDGKIELWFANNYAACHVIAIDGIGYEFACTIPSRDFLAEGGRR